MKAKMETTAEKYRRIKAERAAQEELFDFVSPSGMEWKLRRPNIAQFVQSGVMPMDLAAKLAKAQAGGATELVKGMEWQEQVKLIDFSNRLVRYCAVDPRIVENPTQPNEIGYDEVELDDYTAILVWATPSGGDEAAGLDTFPKG